MDAELIILLRFAERLLAVCIGGLAIYLGYRLFRSVPEAKDSEGRVTLSKDFSVVISRVGPGVFFALFGAATVGLSLHEAVTFTTGLKPTPAVTKEVTDFRGSGSAAPQSEQDAKRARRNGLRREIAVLNALPAKLNPALSDTEQQMVTTDLRYVKFALMQPVWGEADAGWGTPKLFEDWLYTGASQEPPQAIAEAVRYFNYPN